MKRNKKTPYLDFYYSCLEAGGMPIDDVSGLCGSIGSYPNFSLIKPTEIDFHNLQIEQMSIAYWASGLMPFDEQNEKGFTPLRQTIVLFLAAMNNEL